MKNKGFTLIELLVVIAIIGILSSVVLASLNSARSKGTDASIKSQLAGMRAQAEIYYDGTGGNKYAPGAVNTDVGVCTADDGIKNMLDSVKKVSTAVCAASSTAWGVTAVLKTGDTWCVDSTGYSATSTAAVVTATKAACK